MPTYRVPEVYVERRPRAEPAPAVRTDVVGFVGLEPRVRAGRRDYAVDVAAFELEIAGRRTLVAAVRDFDLLGATAPVDDGDAIVFALVAARRPDATARLVAVPGVPAVIGAAVAPADAAITLAEPWLRIADVVVERTGARIAPTIHPRLGPVRCDDWRDFVRRLGEPADDGLLLGAAVRAYFANGGGRAWVGTVVRPPLDAAAGALDAIVGVQGSPEQRATGVERLLLIDEVSIIDLPDLYARRVVVTEGAPLTLPRDEEARFASCTDVTGSVTVRPLVRESLDPIFTTGEVTATQQRVIQRCLAERWRVLLVFSPPLERDPTDGRWRTPSDAAIKQWAAQLATIGDDLERSSVALYAPWLHAQERVDAPVIEMPPSAFAAAAIARRDLARGPHVAPANEVLRGVVALADELSDDRFAAIYDEPPFVNSFRPFAGEGIRVWGARTLSTDAWMRWVSVRRCLSAIERRMRATLEPLVFEPNTPLLWLHVTQLALGVLLPLFEAGALRGDTPEQAFFVRCGPSNNPPEAVQNGRLVCEVGVAIAAPAEFIVFRVGRREGVVEVLE